MEKTSSPSGRIQKTTSKIAFMGLAAATMMITVSIVGAIQLQEASAARPTQCFVSAVTGVHCGSPGACHQLYHDDPAPISRCRNV